MKKFLVALLVMLLSSVAHAQTESEILICALSSLSSYSGEENILARDILTTRGWNFSLVNLKNSRANVKAGIYENIFQNRKTKILVIAGTEDIKDVEVDFRLGKVPLHEGTDENIFVHCGFRDYTDSALNSGLKDFLLDDLKNNPDEILYITGHSLGGAVALMTAIRLCDAGADMNKIIVITFGAPALGNRELADAYENKIDLTRIELSGDVIKKSLQSLGYVHFGNSVRYQPEKSSTQSAHSMAVYLDTAIRNYYDNGGGNFPANKKIDAKVFVAPIKIVQKSFLPTDEKYILPMLTDGLNSIHANLIFAEPRTQSVKSEKDFSYDVTEFLQPAKSQGCKFILVQFLRSATVKDSRQRESRVTLDEMIFDSTGALLSMQTAAPTTKNLTVIEAAAFAQETLRQHREEIFTATSARQKVSAETQSAIH